MTTLTIIIGIAVLVGVGFYLTKPNNNGNNNTSGGGSSPSNNDNKDVNVK